MMFLRRSVFIIKGGRAAADASFLSSPSLSSSSLSSSSESGFVSSRRSIGTTTKFISGTTTKTTSSSSLASREVGKDENTNNNNKERDENERLNATTIQTTTGKTNLTTKTNGRRSTSNYRREIQKRLMEATSKTMKKTNESASWKRTLRLKREEKMDNRECWTVKEFIEKNCLSSSAAAAYSASDTDEDEMEADDDDFTMTMMEAEDIEEEAVLAMLRKSARAAALAERREEESLKDGDDDSDNSDLAAYYNYVNAVKNSKDDGFSNVHYYSDADEDEIEAKLESIQGLLDALREEEGKEEEEERTTTNNNNSKARANKLESLQTIMDQVYSFREQQQQLALLPEIVVGRTSKSEDLDANDLDGKDDENARGSVNGGGTIFRADSVKRKRKKAMNKHKHRKRKKKDRFKNK